MGPSATNLVRQHSAWNVSPLAAFQVFPDFTQHIARAFHQSQQEEVQEGVADHVAHVDHHLVVDEGRGGEANGDHHGSCAQDWRSKQTGGKVMTSQIQDFAPFSDTLDNPGRFPC